MGLYESFANIRGQILLSDPLPPINKVFSLVIQEERQRELCAFSFLTHDTVALLSKTESSASARPSKQANFPKEWLICTHYSLIGHIVDKCYKLHGYPPGYKFNKPRPAGSVPANANPHFSAHQV
jgi:hypothetical protein